MRREHHGFAIAGLAIAACALVGGVVVALTTLVPGPGEPGWTGAAVEVPYCPADADGCRVFAIRTSTGSNTVNGPDVAHKDWSGAATALNIALPAGTYAISAAVSYTHLDVYKRQAAARCMTAAMWIARRVGLLP